MVTISFTQLRQNAKIYFDAVEKGGTVRVSRHGKIIAEISSPARNHPNKLKKIHPLVIPGISLSKAVLEERKTSSR